MPPYDLSNYRQMLFMLAVGLGLSLLIALARGAAHFGLTLRRRSDKELTDDVHSFGGDVSERNGPVPLVIVLVGLAVLLWSVGYIIYSGAFGV